MPTYSRILLAFDFIKDDDDSVIAKALKLSQETGADLSIIHAIEYPVPVVAPMPGLFEAMETAAKEHLAKLGSHLNIPAERQFLIVGPAKSSIIEAAEKCKADLILIGSHGRHGITTWILGSTAQSVIQHAPCDVLVVKLQNNS